MKVESTRCKKILQYDISVPLYFRKIICGEPVEDALIKGFQELTNQKYIKNRI